MREISEIQGLQDMENIGIIRKAINMMDIGRTLECKKEHLLYVMVGVIIKIIREM